MGASLPCCAHCSSGAPVPLLPPQQIPPGKDLALIFSVAENCCVASLIFLPLLCLCLCTHSHTWTLLFLGCLCAFPFSYNTGKSSTALQFVLEHGHKLQHSVLGCLIPSFNPPAWPEDMGSSARALHGVQNVVQGCPQRPVIQHCPRLGDMGFIHANMVAPHSISCLIPQ